MLAIAIAIAEGIAHQEKEVIVPVKVDPDLIADPEKNIKTIASIENIGHVHMMENITPTPNIDTIHLIKGITTIVLCSTANRSGHPCLSTGTG